MMSEGGLLSIFRSAYTPHYVFWGSRRSGSGFCAEDLSGVQFLWTFRTDVGYLTLFYTCIRSATSFPTASRRLLLPMISQSRHFWMTWMVLPSLISIFRIVSRISGTPNIHLIVQVSPAFVCDKACIKIPPLMKNRNSQCQIIWFLFVEFIVQLRIYVRQLEH